MGTYYYLLLQLKCRLLYYNVADSAFYYLDKKPCYLCEYVIEMSK